MPNIRRAVNVLKDGGLIPFAQRGLDHYGVYKPVWNTVTSRKPIGTNVFERDWDLLVILDTCRVDTLRDISQSVSWVNDVAEIRSVGSMSAEWMLKTFTQEYRDEIAETAFLSGNIWSHRIFNEEFQNHRDHDYNSFHLGKPAWTPVSSDAFARYETVYGFGNQDARLHPEAEHIPHILTDRTIDVARNANWERLIVHYTLPHLNHIAGALDWGPETSHAELMSGNLGVTRDLTAAEKSFTPVKRGEVSANTVRSNFMDNLQLALRYVEILLENVDAETAVISADHGEGFGENTIWGHPYAYPFSPVKTVPWASTTASDEETYLPQYDKLERPPTEPELKEHLKAMGYR